MKGRGPLSDNVFAEPFLVSLEHSTNMLNSYKMFLLNVEIRKEVLHIDSIMTLSKMDRPSRRKRGSRYDRTNNEGNKFQIP